MKVLRIFLKPDGQTFVDVPLENGQTTGGVVAAWQREGLLYNPDVIVPKDAFLYAITWETDAMPKRPTIVPFKPPEGII